jgi:glutathione gamma-glutamylcysteinyltransferase
MQETLYRRPLSPGTIAFSSPDGRRVFSEALAAGGLEGYFPLAEQFHTQSDPAFCGLGSLVMALNSLGVDPGRLWKGPWRWFSEELLDCCVPLPKIRERGLNLDEVACLARCNGADVTLMRADAADIVDFTAALELAARGELVMIAAYDRATIGQTGAGHFSPVGGFHAERELVLLFDVARFKYPPHWVQAEQLWNAMKPIDAETGRARGWLMLRRRAQAGSIGFTMRCEADGLEGLTHRLATVTAAIDQATDVATLAAALVPLSAHVEMRTAVERAHQQALERARVALRAIAAFPEVEVAVGTERAEAVTILLLVMAERLSAPQQTWLKSAAAASDAAALGNELVNLRAQLAALWMHEQARCATPGCKVE